MPLTVTGTTVTGLTVTGPSEEKLKLIFRLPKKIQRVNIETQEAADTLTGLDKKVKDYVQPFMETKYALEHLGAALVDDAGEWCDPIDPSKLDKTINHLVRCYTDISEWRFRILKRMILRGTRFLSADEIKHAFPDFYNLEAPEGIWSLIKRGEEALKNAKLDNAEAEARISFIDKLNVCAKAAMDQFQHNSLQTLRLKKISKYIFAAAIGFITLIVIPIIVAIILKG